ncbi:MAG: hypothetical protein QNJ13_14885 [Paracoccaceae bacterium]|nr:hypothetical protein [Paracoccaceae bacterium]
MQTARPVGRRAASRKYDILTALGAWALARSKTEQRLALRLMTLVTARYNWNRDLLAVGQRDIARLWSCDERTVKREMSRLRAMGWLRLIRQGHRGRVAEYGLGIDAILDTTRGDWERIGPDYVVRLDGAPSVDVVPLIPKGPVPAPDVSAGDDWALAAALLHAEDPALYGAWLRALKRDGRAGGAVRLKAPSRFHAAYVETHLHQRVLDAFRSVDPDIDGLEIVY